MSASGAQPTPPPRKKARPWRAALAAMLCVLLLPLPVIAEDDAMASRRNSYNKAMKAQKARQYKLANQLIRGLDDYPLYPYFVYNDLRRRLHERPVDDVARFLGAYDNSYLATRLRSDWLKQLAAAKRWSTFLEFYRPTDDTTMRCHQLVARLNTGLTEGVLEDTRAIWLDGESLPDSCDPAFKALYQSPLMTEALVSQRIVLAMKAGNPGLARYLSSRLRSTAARAAFTRWQQAHQFSTSPA